VVRSRQFFTAYFVFVFLSFYPQYWQASFKSIGQYYDQTDAFMTFAASISLIGNMVSRLLTGFLIDKVGFKKVTLTFALMCIVLGLTFDYVGKQKWAFMLWLFLS